nr:MAG TPA: hypothetical protein [Caudoviricetes sp.]
MSHVKRRFSANLTAYSALRLWVLAVDQNVDLSLRVTGLLAVL